MSLTIASIAASLDAHVRYPVAGKPDDAIDYQVATLNRAIEKMRVLCQRVFRRSYPVLFTGGSSQSVALTSGSTAWAGTGANGSTVAIPGDLLTYNEIASATALQFAYSGSTGTKAVTVYGDSVVLDGTVGSIVGGTLLEERRLLTIANSRAEWLWHQGLDGRSDYGGTTVDTLTRRSPGIPQAVWLETVLTSTGIEYRARCAPLPNGSYRATLEVETLDSDVTRADLEGTGVATVTGTLTPDITGAYAAAGDGMGGSTIYTFNTGSGLAMLSYDPDAEPYPSWYLRLLTQNKIWRRQDADPNGDYSPIAGTGTATVSVVAPSGTTRAVPGHREYGILRALCLYHWSGSPWFRNDSARPVINQEYQDAVQQLSAFRPNAAASVESVVSYG